jgi:hypothetical protein
MECPFVKVQLIQSYEGFFSYDRPSLLVVQTVLPVAPAGLGVV